MKAEAVPQPILLKDYRQPDYWIPETALTFELGDEATQVQSTLTVVRNETADADAPLVLNGEELKLLSVAIDGHTLTPDQYSVEDGLLKIPNVSSSFRLSIETEIHPEKNLSCEGLYKSGGIFCTQCEAESFRKITFFPDRPDVMSVFTVTVRADRAKYPILLSNGNPVSNCELPNGRHEAVWHDPFKKPAYLFALVAGDLGVLKDTFTTRSGRNVKLEIYARHGLQDRCRHAMDSLKWSMKWDEDVYGLEYDLDIFMIVVAEDFNMGAMENKGLNVFNANYVLANPETATDSDFDGIMAVVAHEYFHNWTGNRITCRDWFQLSLKEGLTVFRDQRFSSDMGSEAVKRIEEIIRLRTNQFAEDAGPMAHPIRPKSYISIDNFYTMTIYEKGSEVIRMIETIVGRDGFRKGMDLYFERHDGQAVTTEDFVAAMADANKVDLEQFKTWYDQAGTPLIKASSSYDGKSKTFTLTLEQSCGPSPGQPTKLPYHIPVAIGLLGKGGKDIPVESADDGRFVNASAHYGGETRILHLRESKQTFTFKNVIEKPVLSLLRNFSAPVRVEYDWTDDELAFLMAHDSDAFSKWEASQTLVIRATRKLVEDRKHGRLFSPVNQLTEAFGPTLTGALEDPAFASMMLVMPAEQYLGQFFSTMDIDALHEVREHLMREISRVHRTKFEELYSILSQEGTEGIGPKVSGRRALRASCLFYLALNDQPEDLDRALVQLKNARNMTDELAALTALNRTLKPQRETAIRAFYEKWKSEPLVINKWLAVQAITPREDALDRLQELSKDPIFDANNPNKIYALYVAFSRNNLARFHAKDGRAYRLIADQVMEIDGRNPQVAARLIGAFNQWKMFDPERQELIKGELTRILAKPGLSSNVFEIASKTLKS